ncbi:hypothetical protein DDI_1245 [Dickeya dianthicola RNS04.9]|nr:hypothetical protein DDI_1245 [Dickeya dianthicola RNS04.9]
MDDETVKKKGQAVRQVDLIERRVVNEERLFAQIWADTLWSRA